MQVTNVKTSLRNLFVLVCSGILWTGCGSDDTPGPVVPPVTGSIDVAVGTFKGKIKVYDRSGPSSNQEYFDAIVTVTKAGSNQLTITPKTGEPYSDATAYAFTSVYYHAGMVNDNGITGSLVYNNSNKELGVVTVQKTATDHSFTFTGTKQ